MLGNPSLTSSLLLGHLYLYQCSHTGPTPSPKPSCGFLPSQTALLELYLRFITLIGRNRKARLWVSRFLLGKKKKELVWLSLDMLPAARNCEKPQWG